MSATETRRAIHREFERLRVTARSPDGLIRLSVGGRGDLHDLLFDPNVLRRPDGAVLARAVVDTAGQAARRAAAQAGELVRPLTDRRRGEPVDAVFDPLLAVLERSLARPPAPPPLNGFPRCRRPDYAGFRDRLIARRERLRTASATATSRDGLVTATVGGRGELTGLILDDRVFGWSDSRRLAAAIVATARVAVEEVGR